MNTHNKSNKLYKFYAGVKGDGNKEPQWLSELTHKEVPWREVRKGYADGENCRVVITKDNMQQYYGGLQ